MQTNETRGDQSATERAEALLDNLGEGIGRLTSLTLRGIERIAAGAGANAAATTRDTASGSSPTQRAERLLDGVGERFGYFAAVAGQRIRKTAAMAREEAEDLWAEAQSVRTENRGRPD